MHSVSTYKMIPFLQFPCNPFRKPLLVSQVCATTDLFFIFIILCFPECHANEITQNMAFEPLLSPTLDGLAMPIRYVSVHGEFLLITGDPNVWINQFVSTPSWGTCVSFLVLGGYECSRFTHLHTGFCVNVISLTWRQYVHGISPSLPLCYFFLAFPHMFYFY